jgi:hypothetical protein
VRGILHAPDYVVDVGVTIFVLGVEIAVIESLRPALWQVSGLAAIGPSEKVTVQNLVSRGNTHYRLWCAGGTVPIAGRVDRVLPISER